MASAYQEKGWSGAGVGVLTHASFGAGHAALPTACVCRKNRWQLAVAAPHLWIRLLEGLVPLPQPRVVRGGQRALRQLRLDGRHKGVSLIPALCQQDHLWRQACRSGWGWGGRRHAGLREKGRTGRLDSRQDTLDTHRALSGASQDKHTTCHAGGRLKPSMHEAHSCRSSCWPRPRPAYGRDV